MFIIENNMKFSKNFNHRTTTIMMMIPTLTKLCTFKVTAHRNKQGRDLKHLKRREELNSVPYGGLQDRLAEYYVFYHCKTLK
jgi:hypothetical protein